MEELAETSKNTPKFSLAGLTVMAKCVVVYDGDTAQFTFRPYPGMPMFRYRCRLAGYNSAEIRGGTAEEKFAGQTAKAALAEDILGEIVTLVLGDFDKYGRPLVTVLMNGVNINQKMITGGYGKPYDGHGPKEW